MDTTAAAGSFSTSIGTDSGSAATISTGGLTKDKTLDLSGPCSDANGVSKVEVYDGATLLGNATISGNSWSYTTGSLSDGSHSFTAKVIDNAGNSTTTAAVTATVDTLADEPSLTAVIHAEDGTAVDAVTWPLAALTP